MADAEREKSETAESELGPRDHLFHLKVRGGSGPDANLRVKWSLDRELIEEIATHQATHPAAAFAVLITATRKVNEGRDTERMVEIRNRQIIPLSRGAGYYTFHRPGPYQLHAFVVLVIGGGMKNLKTSGCMTKFG